MSVSVHRLRTAQLWVLPWHQFTCRSPNAHYIYPFLLMEFHLTKTGSGLNFRGALYPLFIWGRVIGRMLFAWHISPGQKRWQTLLEREISCSQWEGPSMRSRCLAFFPFQLGVGGGIFFNFPWFPICSPIPNVFPNMFPIAPHFYPWKSQASNAKTIHCAVPARPAHSTRDSCSIRKGSPYSVPIYASI